MREENIQIFVRGYYKATDVECYELGSQRMIKLALGKTEDLQKFTSELKDVRDLMDIDVENLTVVMDRDDLETIMFLGMLRLKADELFNQ